jgi:hypothetical protein
MGWAAITARFGFVQTLGATLARRDLLDKRRFRSGGTAWQEADSAKPDLERAKLTT